MKRLACLFIFLFLVSCNTENPNIEVVKEEFRKEGANEKALEGLEYYPGKEKTNLALQKIMERYAKRIDELKQFDPISRTSYFLTQKKDSITIIFDTIKQDSIDEVKVVKMIGNQYIHKSYYLLNGKIIDYSEGFGK